MIGILGIMIILLAVLALVVVKALIGSPWGMFTIAATIPIAILMGVYMRYIILWSCWRRVSNWYYPTYFISYWRTVCSRKSNTCKYVHI